MASLEQTIQVLDLSPKVTLIDLDTFFSFCGTVDKILLERKEDQSQLAYVTFRQPFALQTALLLNDAIIVDRRVRILPLQNIESSSVPIHRNNGTKKTEKQTPIPSAHALVQIISSKGGESLNKAKEVLDERYKLSEKGIVLTQQAKMAIFAAEQTAGRVGEAIVSNEHFSAGALWVSHALDKAAKCAADLGSRNKKN
ncbi:binding partner of acd11 [Thalictrum thalictroides]|uniref:Binding partner of acd11 n=1 Tax=Thalictrum thalictroides TaxID=46969 RepID=A0A7J6XFA5_THATH|nr:binding partner of acd11 [Thalictrum thalictroides]